MSVEPHEILVVSNPSGRDEISQILIAAGLPEPRWGDGSDDTYALYQELAPAVVILCANLEAGDARALASAMRHGAPGAVQIILIGEESGPIRNALDAADFEVDRFLGRPLAAKALLFCVRTGLDEVRAQAAAASGDGDAEPVADDDDLESRITSPMSTDAAVEAARAVERAVDLAIDDFVAEAIGSIGEMVAESPPLTGPEPSPEPPPQPEVTPEEFLDSAWAESPPPREPTLILSGGGEAPPPSTSAPAAAEPAPESPPPPPREPTLILSGGGEAPPPEASVQHQVDVTQREEGESWADASSVRLGELDEDPSAADLDVGSFAGLDDELTDDLDDDLADLHDDLAGAGELTDPGAGGPGGGEFARELRKKMSQMAQRLFPGRGGDGPIVDVGVAHGHQTEIDLASIAVDGTQASLEPEPAPYADLASAETFADAEHAVSTSSGGTGAGDEETTLRRQLSTEVSERGPIDPAETDVATLLAKLFRAGLTGKVVFRSPPAEKVVYFDDGRPVFAASNLPHDRMGDLLYREGKITREQYARSREMLVESGRRMGEILVENGFLKRRELLPAVRRHIEDIVYSLFALTGGEYQVSTGEVASGERIRLSRHPAALILEGVRRKYTLELLERRLGAPSGVVVARDRDRLKSILSVADLSRAERAAIAAMDGEKTISDAASLAGLSLLQVYQLAFGLVALDAAEVLHRGDDADLEIDAVRPPSLVGETDLAIDRQRVMAKHALVAEADYFALLGVRRDASSFEIKRAYEAARRDYAEESFPVEVRDELDDQIVEINELLDEAYRVLRDDSLRRSYLANLRD